MIALELLKSKCHFPRFLRKRETHQLSGQYSFGYPLLSASENVVSREAQTSKGTAGMMAVSLSGGLSCKEAGVEPPLEPSTQRKVLKIVLGNEQACEVTRESAQDR